MRMQSSSGGLSSAFSMYNNFLGLNFSHDPSANHNLPGSTLMFIKKDGKVGIGTTNPKQKLHVNGDYYGKGHLWLYANEGDGNSGNVYIQARDNSGSSSLSMRFRTQLGGTIADAMFIGANGNVGVGTLTPASKLHVAGASSGEVRGIIHNTSTHINARTVLRLKNNETGDFFISKNSSTRTFEGGANTVTIRNEKGPLRIHSEQRKGIFIRKDGYTGIGTETPETQLHVSADYQYSSGLRVSNLSPLNSAVTAFDLTNDQGSSGRFSIVKNSSGRTADGGVNTTTIKNIQGDLRIKTINGNSRHDMIIKDDGKVGIGTETPLTKLHLRGDFRLDGIMQARHIQGADIFGDGPNDVFLQYHTGRHVYIGSPNIANSGKLIAYGNVGIGTANPGSYKLAVNGNVKARQVEVNSQGWADYVFEKEYDLKPLNEVAEFISKNGHLPNVPSEKEVAENGINLGKMDAVLLRKIEELTLYVLELKKENDQIKEELEKLK